MGCAINTPPIIKHMDDYKVKTSCRICGSKKLLNVVDFGEVPLANGLLKNGFRVKKYPLSVNFCEYCSLTTLGVVVDPKILYDDYKYHSSVSDTFKAHCKSLVFEVMSRIGNYNKKVVDIASNDGCLLREFKKLGFNVVGIEPAENLAKIANESGIYTINKFWNGDILLPEKVDCITATNVFAHVDDINGFVKGVVNNLKDGGVFVIEVPWLYRLISGNQFDTIYHEHLSYFLLKPIIYKLKEHSLDVFRVRISEIHGGSLTVFVTNNTSKILIERTVNEVLAIEEKEGLYFAASYRKFGDNIEYAKQQFLHMINDLSHKKIAGFCASAKGTSLINYCGITNKQIPIICDETPAKQGLKVPGANIPIVSMGKLREYNPDYIVLFSWNFIDELKKKTAWFRGRYIIPIPYARVE